MKRHRSMRESLHCSMKATEMVPIVRGVIGESYHPLPWQKLDYDRSKGGFVVDLDKKQPEGAPYYKTSNYDWTPDYGRKVDQYYGVPTYWP